jgi:hypothetical protein
MGDTVVSLRSDAGAFLSGQVLAADGGLSLPTRATAGRWRAGSAATSASTTRSGRGRPELREEPLAQRRVA